MAETRYAFERIRLTDSRTLVEASAGTGKTFTIQHLVLRMVVEAGNWDGLPAGAALPMRNLLVITFTRNAAGELRDRIATVLQRAHLLATDLVQNGASDAAGYAAWAAIQTDPDTTPILALLQYWILQDDVVDPQAATPLQRIRLIRQRLAQAQVDLDLALISTIHTWAHRIVQQKAFASGMRLAQEFTESDAWLETAAADLLRDCYQRGLDWLLPDKYNLQKASHDLRMALSFDPTTEQLRPDVSDLDPQLVRDVIRDLVPVFQAEASVLQEIFDEAATRQVYRGGKTDFYAKALDWLGQARDLFAGFDGLHTPGLMDVLRSVRNLAGFSSYSYITKGKAPELVARLQGLQSIDTLHTLASTCAGWSHWPLVRARAEQLQQDLRGRGMLSFDQLLLQARDAVRLQPELAPQLRQLFPVAIVDEFQDTDPVQYTLFQHVYPQGKPGHSLVLVGDPKQSIYLFRQADVQCYLRARDSADRTVTLDQNFRSDQPLVEALNMAYERPMLGAAVQHDYTPGLQVSRRSHNIQYDAVTARHPARLTRAGQAVTPVQIATLPLSEDRENVPDLVAVSTGVDFNEIAGHVAQKVVHLLDPDNAYCIDDKPVHPGDIALLIRSHARAATLYRHLTQAGIPVVRQTRHSVFHTAEGAELVWILRAMDAPGDPRLLRSAAAARCFGSDPRDLARGALVQAPLQNLFALAQEQVARRGIYAALDLLLRESGGFDRLAARSDGLRAIANLRQGMELLQQAQSEGHRSTSALLQWLHERRAGAAELAGEHELERLENDAAAVQIHTIFASKGLEYPIVLCPDLAVGYTHPRFPTKLDLRALGIAASHDSQTTERYLVLDNEDKELKQAVTEDHQNDMLRQLYVAVTRAKHLVWLLWHDSDEPGNRGKSPLTHWLHATRGKDAVVPSTTSQELGRCSSTGVPLVQVSPWRRHDLTGTRATHAGSTADLQPPPDNLLPTVFADRSSWSFTRLAHGAHDLMRTDTDAGGSDPAEWQGPPDPEAIATAQVHLQQFTPGAHTGNFVHDVFEMADFPVAAADVSAMLQQVQASAARYTPVLRGPGLAWSDPAIQQQTAASMQEVLQVELQPFGFRLADLTRADCFRELEFHLQLQDGAQLHQILAVLQRGTLGETPQATRSLAGMLKGFIDLLAVYEGRLYIVDYKSNLLPAYHAAAVHQSIQTAHYDWQYQLYAVAVSRFCQLMNRRHGTDYSLGGVAYLYVRGMRAGSRDGVHTVPAADLVPRLQALEGFFA